MVVVDELPGDSVAALLDEIIDGDDDLQDVLDHASREVVAAGGEKELKEGEEEELEWLSNKDAFPTLETMAPAQAGTEAARPRRPEAVGSPPPALPPRSQAPEKAERRCRHCGTDETPLWRKGPEGRGTLCNACGVRYQAGRLVPEYRPLNSPTFSPELHSNRHRRVLDLARRREEESAKASPPPPPATE